MKRVLKSFTFWFLLISVLEIFMHQMGQDSKSIVLIRFNPILNMIAESDGFLYSFMKSGLQISCNTIEGQISIYWYIGSVLVFIFYGVILDCIKWGVKRWRSHRECP